MRYYEQRNQVEISRAQGIPLSTVRTHLERGRGQLRERLDRQYGDRYSWCLLLGRLTLPQTAAPTVAAVLSPAAALVAALLLAAGAWVSFQWFGGDDEPAPVSDEVALAATQALDENPQEREEVVPLSTATPARDETATRPPHYFSGMVVQEDGMTPAVGAKVAALKRTARQSLHHGVDWTDATGAFHIELTPLDPAAPEPSWLCRYPDSLPDAFMVQSDDHARLFRFPLFGSRPQPAANPDGGVDLGTFTVQRGTRVSGRVVDDAGAGIPGAKLVVLTEGPGSPDQPEGLLYDVGMTASDGSFVLPEPLSSATSTDSRALNLIAIAGDKLGWTRLNLHSGQAHHEALVVIGRTSLSVLVRDELGQPVSNARVQVIPPFGLLSTPRHLPLLKRLARGPNRQGILWNSKALTAATDDLGLALISNVPIEGGSRLYHLLLDHPECRPKDIPLDLSLVDQRGVEVRLVRSKNLDVWGRVIDAHGAPVPHARVQFENGDEVVTDARGQYRTRISTDGTSTLRLEVRGSGFAPHRDLIGFSADEVSRQLDIQLERSAPTVLMLVDSHGQPIEGLMPRLRNVSMRMRQFLFEITE